MFENVEGRKDDTVIGILIAHLGAFGSGGLKYHMLTHLFKFPAKMQNLYN